MIAVDHSIGDIKVGDSASFRRSFTDADVEAFAKLSGDENPLHTDDAYAATTHFGRRLVHGMLVGSLCSTLVGMYLPGKHCLYLEQNLSFKKPVHIGDELLVSGTVTAKSESTSVLTISISITNGTAEVVQGMAKVKLI
jgi:acyl dehydratase